MSLSTRIAPHLPFLRRYARAITGSQTSGDAYVAATLEALIEDVSIFPQASEDRVALYALFSRIYSSAEVDVEPFQSPYIWEQRASANLKLIPAMPRQAFLLFSVEGFTAPQISEILNVDDLEVDSLLAEASAELSRQVATEIMIIEDEPVIAMDIRQLVEDLGHKVSGVARTHAEALELYHKSSPKMILADIQLADGSSGIDAVNDILKTDTIPVIFITAFPERLLTGERPEPTFLVTKPFSPEMLMALISQALFFRQAAVTAA